MSCITIYVPNTYLMNEFLLPKVCIEPCVHIGLSDRKGGGLRYLVLSTPTPHLSTTKATAQRTVLALP